MKTKQVDIQKLPLVKVVWEDVLEDSSWAAVSDLDNILNPSNRCLVISYGLLYKKNKKFVVLVTSVIPHLNHVGSILKIPASLVQSIELIQKPEC